MKDRLKIFYFFLVLIFVQNLCAVKGDKKASGNYTVKSQYADFSRLFIEETVRNHPKITASIMSFGILYWLYPEKMKNSYEFMLQYRDILCGMSLAGLAYAYWNRQKILDNIVGPELVDDGAETENKIDSISAFSKCGVRIYRPGEIKTTFQDVAGLQAAKEDLADIVLFLKNPYVFREIGAHVPKGILLAGSPGNGKTLLARALAGEVRCPFLYINATEFIEAIVGVGAARIRHLFAIAKELAPCIIFIDEIDAIGKKRSSSGLGGDSELTQSLNQLLAEMDGFEQQENPIVIIGATNREDILDEALMRSGRFDRKINIPMPFVKDRFHILKVHFKHVKTVLLDADLEKIAHATRKFSGADLAQLVNEAAILAIRQHDAFVDMHHVDQARDYMLLGRELHGMDISQEELWQTAVHEAGHALVRVYQKDAMPLYKVTITPRGDALGITFGMQSQERYSHFEQEMRAEIAVKLAGSVAEELMFSGRGAGACSDLESARELATDMVMRYGMTDEFKDVTFSEFIYCQHHLPDEIATKLHQAVAKVIKDCRAVATKILTKHKDNLEKLANMLLDQGTVSGQDVYQLCEVEQPELTALTL